MANTGIKLNIDAGQAQNQIDSMTGSLDSLIDKLAEATEAGNWREAANLTWAVNNLQSAEKQGMSLYNQQRKDQAQGYGGGNSGSALVSTADRASGAVSTLAGGNYAGAAISATRGIGSGLRDMGKDMGGGNLSKILSGFGIGSILAGAAMGAGNALSEQYEGSLPAMNSLNKTFGTDVNMKSMGQNNGAAMEFYSLLKEEANRIGMALDEFAEVVVDMAKYGVGSYSSAKKMAANAGSWANFTNSDIGTLQNYAGFAGRYGDNADVLNVAYGGARASGLEKGQYGEFLTGLQKVMEDGIANGYQKTTEEIATNLTMFSRLSGGSEMWKGEQGVSRLMKINQSIAGATEMRSVSDMIIATAANTALGNMSDEEKRHAFTPRDKNGNPIDKANRQTDTYIDSMLLMEQGANPDMFANIAQGIQQMQGGNIAGQIEMFKSAFNMNYTGAVDIYNMAKKIGKDGFTEEDFTEEVQKMQTNPDYQSDEQKRQAVLNNIHSEVVSLGKKSFDIKIAGLGGIEKGVNALVNKFIGSGMPDITGLYDKGEGKSFLNVEHESQFKKAYKDNPEAFAGFNHWWYGLSHEEIEKLNSNNLLNIEMTKTSALGQTEINRSGVQDWNAQWRAIQSAGGVDAYIQNNHTPQYISSGLQGFENKNLSAWGSPTSSYFANSMLHVNASKEQEEFDNGMMNGFKKAFSSEEEFQRFLSSDNKKFDELQSAYYQRYANPNGYTQDYLDDKLSLDNLKKLFNESIDEYKKSDTNDVAVLLRAVDGRIKGLCDDMHNINVSLG